MQVIFIHLLIPVYVFGEHFFWLGRVVIPVYIQRVHHFFKAGLAEMVNQVICLWKLQSGPSHVASSVHLMLGSVTPLCNFSDHYKGLHIIRPPFPCQSLSVRSHCVLVF